MQGEGSSAARDRSPSEPPRRPGALVAGILALAAAGLPAAEEKPAAGARPAPAAPTREASIYIPYETLASIFEKRGRGVYLPYEEFIDLWRRAVAPKRGPEGPPVAGVIERALYEGTVEGEAVRFRAALQVSVLREGWARLPLGIARLGLESVSFPDVEPGELVLAAGEKGMEILARRAGRHAVEIRFLVPVKIEPGLRSIAFPVPRSSVTRLDLRIPGERVTVDVSPAVASTVVPEEGGAGKETHVLAFLGGTEAIRASWRPRVEEAVAREPLVFADLISVLRVREGFLRAEATADYRILQAPTGSFALELPEGYTLISVEGEGLRDWKLEGRALKVALHAPIRDSYRLALTLERAFAADGGADFPFPAVATQGTQRETGTLLVAAAEGWRAKVVRAEGLSQIDVRPFAGEGEGKKEPLLYGFRYLRRPLELRIAAERVVPRVAAALSSILSVDRDLLELAADLALEIERAGIFRIALQIPAGWELDAIQGPQHDHRVVPDAAGGSRIEIDLGRKVAGDLKLSVALRSAWQGPAGRIEIAPPRVAGADAQRGILGVAAAPGLKLSTVKAVGWTAVSVAELRRQGIAPSEGRELVLAFRYRGTPEALALVSEPRATRVLASLEHDLAVEEGLLRARAIVRRTILYAGTSSLTVRAPKDVAEAIRVEGQDVKETRVEPDPGDAAWASIRIALQSEVLGEHAVVLRYERRLPEAPGDEPVEIPVAMLSVPGAFREEGWIAVRKAPVLDLEPRAKGLDPVDVKELPATLRAEGVALAFRYPRPPWSLLLRARRLAFESLVSTFVRHGHIDTVVTPERVAQSELCLAVRNKRAQFLRVKLPEGSKVFGLSVAGRETPISRAPQGDAILVELSHEGGEEREFAVRLRYDTPLRPGGVWGSAGALHLVSPDLLAADEAVRIPVGRFTWTLYLPPDYRCVGRSGNLRRVEVPERLWTWLRRELLGERDTDRRDAEALGLIARMKALDARGAPLPYRVVTEGLVPVTFVRVGDKGWLEVRYLKRELAYGIEVGIGAILLLLGGVLMRLGVPSIGVVLAALIIPLAGRLALRPEWAAFSDGPLVAAGVLAAVALVRAVGGRARGRRERGPLAMGLEDYVRTDAEEGPEATDGKGPWPEGGGGEAGEGPPGTPA